MYIPKFRNLVKSLVILILTTHFCCAQKDANIWYFGDHAGLDFNSGTPVILNNGALLSYDNSSTISDSMGSLLFYTNGVTVWNKNHVVMNNGNGLLGNNNGGQCVLIVPKPNSSLYYIFCLDQFAGPNGLHYSIVDMMQQGGLGSVVTKNVLLFTPSTEKIDAIYNCADDSYWILTHTWNTSNFNCYKLNSSGLNTTPVVSNVGVVNTGGISTGYNAMGQMTFSKDGSRVVSGIYSDGLFQLFDFDMSSGILSNAQTITGYTNAWGAAFSPDGTKLYTTKWMDDKVFQFDLTVGSIAAIMASATVVGTASSTTGGGYQVGYLQIAPDDKIYAARYGEHYIGVINDPNQLGLTCNFVDTGVYLGTNTCNAGLSRVEIRNGHYSNSFTSNGFCLGNVTSLQLFDSVHALSCTWNFDDPLSGINNSSVAFNPNHIFSNPGTYNVSAILNYNCYTDTIFGSVTIYAWPVVNLGNDTTLCTGNSITLNVANGYTSYTWQDGSSNSTFTATATGNYFVTVDYHGCSVTDSISIQFNPCSFPGINFASSDTNFCEKNCIDFYDLSTNNPTSWQWYFPGAVPDTSTMQNPTGICYNSYGNYNVTLYACNNSGCDSLTINQFINEIQNPIDSIWVSNDTLYSLPFPTYQWYSLTNGLIAGATNQYFVPAQAGTYYCMTEDSIGCVATSNAITITAVQSEMYNSQFAILPNPNNGNFEIVTKDFSQFKNSDLRIIDAHGKIIFEKLINNQVSNSNLKFNLNLADGVYLLLIFKKEQVFEKKFLVGKN